MDIKYIKSACAILLILTTGCSKAGSGREITPTKAKARLTYGTSRTYTRGGNYEQRTEERIEAFEKSGSPTKARAQKLADGAAGLDIIERASVAISGNMAVVGIELKDDLTDENLIKAKDEVQKKLKGIDPEIDHIAVTADGELIERISVMSDSASGEK